MFDKSNMAAKSCCNAIARDFTVLIAEASTEVRALVVEPNPEGTERRMQQLAAKKYLIAELQRLRAEFECVIAGLPSGTSGTDKIQ